MARKPKPSGRKLPDKGKPLLRQRPVNRRELRPRFLIVCEGEKTEPNYFRSFRVNAVVEVRGIGRNTLQLVEYARKLQNEANRKGQPYTQVWIVLDRDTFPAQDFNDAIRQAEKEGFGVAYSNEAFELWYVLHFEYLDSAISRRQYQKKLAGKLKRPYRKNDITLYRHLLPHQDTAIRNAQKLLASYPTPNPARDNPCTTVHLLVQELNRHLR
ncbi:MAG: RloB domain-containing protein [Caldilineae bacterium]|nr:MAG: RloB domain-containing protein [Caldilineae bacterium]